MNSELEERLFNRFSYMFRGRNMSIKTNLMPFGIECGDGWFKLIWDACVSIQAILDKSGNNDFIFTQVKEKFGRLCLYYTGGPDGVQRIIRKAENYSCLVCETCGKEGAKSRDVFGWSRTECSEHYQDRKHNRQPRKASDYVNAMLKNLKIMEREEEIERRKTNE